jgi:hypothetical protein
MADLGPLTVGQKAVAVMTFSEAPSPDGVLTSDHPEWVTASLGADLMTGTYVVVGAPADGSIGIATITYTGTSVAPDVGPDVVSPGTISVAQAPVAETGNLNLGGATVS